MSITKEELSHIAGLAKLYVSEEECETLLKEMEQIVAFARKIDSADVAALSELEHFAEGGNVLREDVVCPSFYRGKMLANAPRTADGCIQVPKILD